MEEGHNPGPVTRTDSGDVCEPCKFDNTQRPAAGWCEDCDEKLCENCHTAHRKLKQSRDHKFWSIREMDVRKQRPKIANKCKKHENEILKYFCVEHSQLGCGHCFVATHRQCSNVICITDFKTTGSKEYKVLEALLENLESRLNEIQEKTERNNELSASQYDKAIADVEGAGEKLKSLIDRLVKEQVEKVNKAREEDMRKMREIEETTADAVDNVKVNREILAAEQTDNNQLFITMKYVQGEALDLESKLTSVEEKNTVTEKVFVLNPDLADVLEKVTELGAMRDTEMVEIEKGTDEVVEDVELRRFQQTALYFGPTTPDAVHVSTDQTIRLLYVLLYPLEKHDTDVELTVLERSKCLVRCKGTYKGGATRDVIDVPLISEGGGLGVTLRVGQCYDIVVTIRGCGTIQFGRRGKDDVIVNGVKFTFCESGHSQTIKKFRGAQIAGFRFSCL